jgi:hypothetical protein
LEAINASLKKDLAATQEVRDRALQVSATARQGSTVGQCLNLLWWLVLLFIIVRWFFVLYEASPP